MCGIRRWRIMHCTVTCTVTRASYGSQTFTINAAASTLTVSDPAVDYGAGDTVVISTKSTSAEECECAGVYTVQSSGLSATAVPVLPSLSDEECTASRCVVDRTAVTVPGLTNGVWYRLQRRRRMRSGTSVHSEWGGNCVKSGTTASDSPMKRTQAQCTAVTGSTWYASHDVYGGVSPGSTPSAPTSVSATTADGGGAVLVSFSAPTDDGGHELGTYTVYAYSSLADAVEGTTNRATLSSQSEWTGTSSPIKVTGTQDGTAYWFRVKVSKCAGRRDEWCEHVVGRGWAGEVRREAGSTDGCVWREC